VTSAANQWVIRRKIWDSDEHAGTLFYKSNLGDGRHAPRPFAANPSVGGLAAGTARLVDLDADGGRQLALRTDDLDGYVEIDGDGRAEPFVPFAARLEVDRGAPGVLELDLDGDGRPDLLITEECVLRIHSSLGRLGYARGVCRQAPGRRAWRSRLVNDLTQRIVLADSPATG
jgi:hypothetical protein